MLIARVRRTIVKRSLFPTPARVLCACSGGPDSAALLYVLARLAPELGFELHAASVDHGLRPDAQRDVEIAACQAATLSVPFRCLQVSVAPGSSVQARAREQRYAVLAAHAREIAATRIAVGHTQDDQAETVLARLLRGSGLRGLAAIDPHRADGVVRPLIDCDREAVHGFAREHFTELAVDPSNQNERFERVRIRTHLLPALRVEDSALVRHLSEVADDARDLHRWVDQVATELLERAQLDKETLKISVLRCQPAALRTAALRLWLARALDGHTIGRDELAQLDAGLRSGRGEVWISARHLVRVEQGELLQLRLRTGAQG